MKQSVIKGILVEEESRTVYSRSVIPVFVDVS